MANLGILLTTDRNTTLTRPFSLSANYFIPRFLDKLKRLLPLNLLNIQI